MTTTIRPTRYEELGYIQDDKSLWRFVDIVDGNESRVGPHYKSKAELLADLDRYARFYGCGGQVPGEFDARTSQPTEPLGHDSKPLSFRVWGHDPAYDEDPAPWKCSAAFRYLLEALDYIAYCQDRGHDIVFETPADTKLIRHTDRRVVYRGEPPTVPSDVPLTTQETRLTSAISG